MSFTTMILFVIYAMLINNIVLMQFLGICPYIGVSKRQDTAFGMGMAVIFVMVLATAITWLCDRYLLIPFKITYLRTIVFIIVIAALVQFVELFMKKSIPALYRSLGIYLPLITTNCTILGTAILAVQKNYNFFTSVIYAVATGTGFLLAIFLFASIRERLDHADIPEIFKGVPIALITASLMSMAFMGFSGLVKNI